MESLCSIKAPRRALWEITWRCDLRCAHCLVNGGKGKGNELNTDEALELVDQIAELGISSVSLTGGEPFLRRDWAIIAKRIRSHGMTLRFASNGHLVDENLVEQLLKLDAKSFSVSIDGVKETHDKIRHGSGRNADKSSFDRVLKTLDMLRLTSIRAGVITAITKQNLDELPEIHSILKKHGVQRWIVQLAHRTGRLSNLEAGNGCEPIEPRQLLQVADFIVRNSQDPVLQPKAFNSIGYLSRQEPVIRKSGRNAKNPIWRGCTCGLDVIGIEPDGGIKGCANQVGKPFVVGNIRSESLKEIWRDRKRWFWLNPAPEKMTGECAGCPLAGICHAGCTTLALRTSGQLFNNPYCLRRLEKMSKEN